MKTLRETFGAETKFTQSLKSDIDSFNKICRLTGLPEVISVDNEVAIPGGSIDNVGITAKGDAIIFEHQDLSGRADQTHVSKTMTYPHQYEIKYGKKVLGSILACESVDEHYVEQFRKERKEYERRKYNGHKNLHIIKSQWTDEDEYSPELFDDAEIIRTEEAWPLDVFRSFVDKYARDWTLIGEEHRPGTVTLWFRDVTRGRYYIHKLKKSVKVGVHFDNPTDNEKTAISNHENGRHGKKRSTIEIEIVDGSEFDWWLTAEKLKQYFR